MEWARARCIEKEGVCFCLFCLFLLSYVFGGNMGGGWEVEGITAQRGLNIKKGARMCGCIVVESAGCLLGVVGLGLLDCTEKLGVL